MASYAQINRKVMMDTVHQCQTNPELQDAIWHSIKNQQIVKHGYDLEYVNIQEHKTQFVISGKRTFEAAKAYRGRKVAVLNFANNHSIGGAPFSAGAQEESLCRCSTLYPCLQAMKEEFYDRHRIAYEKGEMNYMGNDDLIYTPCVVVFKSDELTDPIYPKMTNEWFEVDVITCAAPELWHGNRMPSDYEAQITSRIKQILDAAAVLANADVLVLGAWGCGAFRNPADIVARVFREQLKNYNFAIVEYALSHRGDLSNNSFARALMNSCDSAKKPTSEYNRKYTDNHISSLLPNQVFVFGSNIKGKHGGGAARLAQQRFGAEYGVGEGMTGQCYAIPTMEGGTSYIGEKVEEFISYALAHPEKEFLVTKIACGSAGFSIEEIAPLFADAISVRNIILPKEFVDVIEKKRFI